jgi:hypothetical protein
MHDQQLRFGLRGTGISHARHQCEEHEVCGSVWINESLAPEHPRTAGQVHLIGSGPTAECGFECQHVVGSEPIPEFWDRSTQGRVKQSQCVGRAGLPRSPRYHSTGH